LWLVIQKTKETKETEKKTHKWQKSLLPLRERLASNSLPQAKRELGTTDEPSLAFFLSFGFDEE
jgi:hypothetical protein